VWFWRPDAGAKFFARNKFAREMTVARKPGHREEHEVSRKTTAQGKPVLLRLTCGPTPVLFVARGPWVQPAPGFPCALYSMRGRKVTQSSDAKRRENAHVYPLRCLKFKSGPNLVIASAAKQSIAPPCGDMDCFASLRSQ
jgi:hypothetical protein